jgi:N-ethylmaleimide reductase
LFQKNQHYKLDKLFESIRIGKTELANRIVMAPLTRKRATRDNIPTAIMIKYYRQRSSAGLIISEATNISPEAVGYFDTPGIFNETQVEAWKRITGAVHDEGGKIFMQLWHTGRHSHPTMLPGGQKPLAPSAVNEDGLVNTPEGHLPTVVPMAMTKEDIERTIGDYKRAAANALKAGFDGVEIHGANGYLPHQFLMESTNKRTDEYGGDPVNRARFLFRVIREVLDECGPDQTALRLSPIFMKRSIWDPDPISLFEFVIKELNNYDLAYLHLTEPAGQVVDYAGWTGRIAPHFRKIYEGQLMICGGYDRQKASEVVEKGYADLVAFGRPYISNPNLVERFKKAIELTPWDEDTFYEGGERGYIDY